MEQKSQLARLGLFDAKVPRYTSYPTAPNFHNDVDNTLFSRWLSEVSPGSQVSLYVHVPFCRRLCWFCACRTQGTQSDAPVRAYVAVLKQELQLLAQNLPAEVTLSRLHWGGGTPTLLSPDLITDLAESIAEVLPFAPGAEFSVEIDPNELDAQRLAALSRAGMTRASIGVQDFDPTIQQAIGRAQSYEVTRRTAEMIRAEGIRSLNADILYGLPHQTGPRITDSVQKLLSLSPDRVALYGYAHVPWMARRQTMISPDSLPSAEERLTLFETAQKLFHWDGYQDIGIDHFALPQDGLARAQRQGTLRRNFQGYTDDPAETLIGIGASSISRFPKGYAQNASATSKYTESIRSGRFATARGHVFTGDDAVRGRLIEALMCDFAIDVKDITDRFALPGAEVMSLLKVAEQAFPGMVEYSAKGLRIRDHARPMTRMIARAFDRYELSKTGHSAAI